MKHFATKHEIPLRCLLIPLALLGCDRKAEEKTSVVSAPSPAISIESQAHSSPSPARPPLVEEDALVKMAREVRSLRRRDKYIEGNAAMEKFVSSWNPVGRKTEELIALVGQPDDERRDEVKYGFDSGYGGWGWIFHSTGGVITSVQRWPID